MHYRKNFEWAVWGARDLAGVSEKRINEVLLSLANETENFVSVLLEANRKDLSLMDSSDARYDRLKLTEDRIRSMAHDIRSVTALPSPLGRVLEERKLPNGLRLSKVSVPFGVVGVIYESRPNVTLDVFSLCIKSGNACVLKGGSDAQNTNEAIVTVIKKVLEDHRLNTSLCVLMPSERSATDSMLSARGYIDVIIPRGSRQLIDYVADHARVPVIETGAGIVHIYLDEEADLQKAAAIITNAKTRRVSVCNALDCLIIHQKQLINLPFIVSALADNNVIIYADNRSYSALDGRYPSSLLGKATKDSFGTEFLSYKMAIKTVLNFDSAMAHIRMYSSRHSEAIISTIPENIKRFLHDVDAAVVYSNSSTAFTDGGQFGMGAEVGISTQKLHARGPMGLSELTSYKWIVQGDGQVRS